MKDMFPDFKVNIVGNNEGAVKVKHVSESGLEIEFQFFGSADGEDGIKIELLGKEGEAGINHGFDDTRGIRFTVVCKGVGFTIMLEIGKADEAVGAGVGVVGDFDFFGDIENLAGVGVEANIGENGWLVGGFVGEKDGGVGSGAKKRYNIVGIKGVAVQYEGFLEMKMGESCANGVRSAGSLGRELHEFNVRVFCRDNLGKVVVIQGVIVYNNDIVFGDSMKVVEDV